MLSLFKKYFSRKVTINIISGMMLFFFMGEGAFAGPATIFQNITTPLTLVINSAHVLISNVNNFKLDPITLTDSDIAEIKATTDAKGAKTLHWCASIGSGSGGGYIGNMYYKNLQSIQHMSYNAGMTDSSGSTLYSDLTIKCGSSFSSTDLANNRTVNVVVSLITMDGGVDPGVYHVDAPMINIILMAVETGTAAYASAISSMDGTITVTASTCQLQTSRDLSVNWPSVWAEDIQNNTAENKPAVITLGCEDNSSHPITVNITNNYGYADAANGVVNTSTSNLGLQLTWGSNGQKIPLNQPMSFDAKDIKDFSVNAQPVATGAGTIASGNFATDVTVSFEYH